MVSTFTANINLEEPARGDYVGTWDTPVNSNMTVLDTVVGGTVSIALNNSPVVLSAAQYQCKTITFFSTLTGSVLITFPASFQKSYEIRNACTGSSAFIITLQTTVAGPGTAVCPPPGEITEIAVVSGNIFFKSLDRVGAYWDYAGSSVPAWVTGCSIPPYLACTGGTFSATTYPALAAILGSTTLPDTRGRARFTVDGGATRLTSAISGLSPNTVGSGGGDQNIQQHNHNIFITDPQHRHTYDGMNGGGGGSIAAGGGFQTGSGFQTSLAATGITATSSASGTGTAGNVPPAYIGGITMIRAG